MGRESRLQGTDRPAEVRALVFQLGAREHYLVARCFAKSNALAALVTDFWFPYDFPFRKMLESLPQVVLSAMARRHPDLHAQRVISFPCFAGLKHLLKRGEDCDQEEQKLAIRFARKVIKRNIPHNVFFGYSYDSLELLLDAKKNGVFTVLCQTDPGPGHYRMIDEEAACFPEYASPKNPWWNRHREERLLREWTLADVIVVNSEWTRTAIVADGADASKIEVLPLAYTCGSGGPPPEVSLQGAGDLDQASAVDNQGGDGRASSMINKPLKILWLGNVSLGKGIQYLIEAAKLLVDQPVEFLIAGALQISPDVIKTCPQNIRWLGRIPRSRTSEVYGSCDIFVFPTLSDGFGLTQLEAMAQGLPVIATPNCGSVVRDHVTGFIVPPRDSRALADAILRFAEAPKLASEMAPACRQTLKDFSVDAYNRCLFSIIHNRRSCAEATRLGESGN